jgi:ethylbenzene dioxygenase subunit beta
MVERQEELPIEEQRVLAAEPAYGEVVDWLADEAELLDGRREREWLERMVSREVIYRMPMRQTVLRGEGAGFLEGMFHLNDRYGSLYTKVARNETGFAWGDDPPARSRHFVTNVRVYRQADGTLAVRTSLLLFQSRRDDTTPNFISCERQDVLRRESGRLKLFRRQILVDFTALETHNLAIFF